MTFLIILLVPPSIVQLVVSFCRINSQGCFALRRGVGSSCGMELPRIRIFVQPAICSCSELLKSSTCSDDSFAVPGLDHQVHVDRYVCRLNESLGLPSAMLGGTCSRHPHWSWDCRAWLAKATATVAIPLVRVLASSTRFHLCPCW